MHLRISSALLLLAAATVAPACSVSTDVDQGPSEPAPTSLAKAKIPADFTFATTRPAGIQISVNPKLLPQGVELPVEIYSVRNELLAAAKPSDEGKVVLDYPLPVGDTQVVVKVGDQQQILTLDKNHSASASFE
ncbi:MAG: hypothetical protein U0359_01410 [Byssovorax sp.]